MKKSVKKIYINENEINTIGIGRLATLDEYKKYTREDYTSILVQEGVFIREYIVANEDEIIEDIIFVKFSDDVQYFLAS